ncbi:MAG TPA: phospholipase C, phosphocholine-specific [Rhizomicrobium sp.]
MLKTAALGGLAAALPAKLQAALSIPANSRTGSIFDVQHVVVLMHENRSFDHYFGTLRGVRGFGDPRPLTLPDGKPVWFQPSSAHPDGHIAPFRMNTKHTRAQCLESLDHSWKKSQAAWANHDAWIDVKGPMTMGHFTREDIPFYYALADTFTICDAYHCSIFGPTNPNRLFLFTGTNGISIGDEGLQAIQNPTDETNNYADPALDDPRFTPLTWTTYAERLQAAGIDWRVYQEYDNYGDNGLAYFANFRGEGAKSDIGRRARSWPATSNKANAAISRGEHIIAQFAKDVKENRLPQVSWIVAPYIMCEHPAAPPGYGEMFTSRLLSALAANPAVWAKTVFILNYDENDGFFDHVPPPVPPSGTDSGKSTVDVAAEIYQGEPVGLGPRVPLIVVSPWSRGGFVNSQLSDHTSVIRFLETRFGVAEPNISPWRRAVCSDLTSMFDFVQKDVRWTTLPATSGSIAAVDETCTLQHPEVPSAASIPMQEIGQRAARPLPYDIRASVRTENNTFNLNIENEGKAGAVLTLYDRANSSGPWYYTVEAGKTVSDAIALNPGRMAFELHGPNGFLHAFRGMQGIGLSISTEYDPQGEAFLIRLSNRSHAPIAVASANLYADDAPHSLILAPGATVDDRWPIAASAHWYDVSVTLPDAPDFLRRFAGHIETGKPSLSDPAFGRKL